MAKGKNRESSITQEIIDKVHITLANFKSGEDVLNFVRETEPVFMSEVSRFVQAEISRFRFDLPHSQSLYLGSVIAAAYISGFLVAREAQHKLFDGEMCFSSPVRESITTKEFDKLSDKYSKEGLSPKEMAKLMNKTLKIEKPINRKNKKDKTKSKKRKKGRRLDIDGLE